ncbi:MAG: hypothetical protein WAL92_02235, partial [Thiogranum sp.]
MSSNAVTQAALSAADNPLQPELPATGTRVVWSRLYGDSLPLALARAADIHNGLLLIVTADSQDAERLQQQLEFFCADRSLDVLCFSDWETLPYD